jgi:predicted component of type VI protein secretion system
MLEDTNFGCCDIFGGENTLASVQLDFMTWIESIQKNPTNMLNTTDYNNWLNLFNQYHSEYSSSISNNLSSPSALYDLVKTSDCF